MSEESISSSRRPIASLDDYRERNDKRTKDYYYRNHDTLKTKPRERAQAKRGQLQESVKTVPAAVADISLALVKIQDALKLRDPARLDAIRFIFVINQATMNAPASASAPAPALTRVELVIRPNLIGS
jgi:hypothetical protein